MSKQIGEAGDRGVRNSQASAAGNFNPQIFRLLKYSQQSSCWIVPLVWFCAGLILLLGIFINADYYILVVIAGFFCLVRSLFGWYTFMKIVSAQKSNYKNGLLTASMVLEIEPNLTLIHIASLVKSDSYEPRYGVYTALYKRYPEAVSKGQKIPSSSGFLNYTNNRYTWDTFIARPIPFGTSDQAKIDRTLEIIEFEDDQESPYFVLDRFLKKNPNSTGIGWLYVCDKEGTQLEKRDDPD